VGRGVRGSHSGFFGRVRGPGGGFRGRIAREAGRGNVVDEGDYGGGGPGNEG